MRAGVYHGLREGRDPRRQPRRARGGPDAVFEIRSPGDESYEKLPFYAALGVREIVIIPRDLKKPELYTLAGSQYVAVTPDAHGFLLAETMGVCFGHEPGPPPRLLVVDASDPQTSASI